MSFLKLKKIKSAELWASTMGKAMVCWFIAQIIRKESRIAINISTFLDVLCTIETTPEKSCRVENLKLM